MKNKALRFANSIRTFAGYAPGDSASAAARSHRPQQKVRYRISIHLGCRSHPFVRLARQLFDADIREDGSEGVGDVEVARAFSADLEHHRDSQRTKALGFEVVPTQRTQIT